MALLSGRWPASGFDVRLNERLIGGWTVQRFAAHDRVDAIQVELSQRRYLDLKAPRTRPGPPPPGDFEATAALLREVLATGVIAPLLAQYPPL